MLLVERGLNNRTPVGSSMQDLSCDDLNFINGPENTTSANAKLEPGVSSQIVATNNGSIRSLLSNKDTQKFDAPILKGVKLEDSDDKGSCSSLFVSKLDRQQITESIKSEETAAHWPPVHSIFNRNETSGSNQHQSHQHYGDHADSTFQYQSHHQLLLQSSDDPLISYGANSVINDDDHSVELKHLLTAASSDEKQQQRQQHYSQPLVATKAAAITQIQQAPNLPKRPKNGCSSLTKQQLKVKAGLMSAANQQRKRREVLNAAPQQISVAAKQNTKKKSQPICSTLVSGNNNGTMKLRFHHQALPPEYLSHFEATQRRFIQEAPLSRSASSATTSSPTTCAVKAAQTAKLPPPKSSHENVRSWLQKIAEIQRAAQQQNRQQSPPVKNPTQQSSSAHLPKQVPQSPLSTHRPTCLPDTHSLQSIKTASPINCLTKHVNPLIASTSNRVINYADLPYMGEITLNNTKPRRGRKPKKADICHLIYKNYGKTIFTGAERNSELNTPPQELRPDQPLDEQPLNLCLRDYQKNLDLYSISSGDDENCDDVSDEDAGDSFSGESQGNLNFSSTPVDAITDSILATNMKASMSTSFKGNKISMEDASDPLLHPVKAYYQKLLESGMLLKHVDGTLPPTFAGLPIETIEKDNQIALKIPIPSGFFLTPKQEPKSARCSTPTLADYPLQEPEAISTPSSIKSEHSFTTTTNSSNMGCCNPSSATQKRKRSAIFIPPMPAENTTNPANEVSICKFKFTGGAKPTLQEKKMLSVDSDGNYRYYSGTGDKATRGYEFFPRESLQQSGGFLPGVNGVIAEKVPIDIPPPSADLTNELLQIPESPTNTILLPVVTSNPSTASASASIVDGTTNSNLHHTLKASSHKTSMDSSPCEVSMHKATQTTAVTSAYQRSKKRSLTSRRPSSQREKLERTFKEKGFLIQTQQLESAEGATYCKFRQLKKFTRYLFRNWKDYLPDGKEPSPLQISEVTPGQQAALESFLAENCFTETQNAKSAAETIADFKLDIHPGERKTV